MPLILSGNVASATASTGYDVDNSCRFNSGDSAKMSITPASDGNKRTWTYSAWIKRTKLAHFGGLIFAGIAGATDNLTDIYFYTDDKLYIRDIVSNGVMGYWLSPNRLFRDPSAWYHIVLAVDTTQATDTNRLKLYINGTQETSLSDNDYPDQDYDTNINDATYEQQIGHNLLTDGASHYFDGYMAEVCFIDGLALTPTSFGEFDSDSPTIWKPIDVSGLTFGTNGFYLDFEDSANLGNDANGGTDLTEANLDATNQATDTPTNNFATMNPLDNYFAGSTFSEGNTGVVTPTAATTWNTGTFGVSAGKWYWEVNYSAKSNTDAAMIGIAEAPTLSASDVLGNTARSVSYYTNGNKYVGTSGASYGNTYTVGDIIGVALDMDNAKLYFSKNGTWQDSGDPESGATGTGAIGITAAASTSHGFYFPAVGDYGTPTTTSITFYLNFGNPSYAISSGNADADGYGNFEYAPPSGYFALCTKNLAEYG